MKIFNDEHLRLVDGLRSIRNAAAHHVVFDWTEQDKAFLKTVPQATDDPVVNIQRIVGLLMQIDAPHFVQTFSPRWAQDLLAKKLTITVEPDPAGGMAKAKLEQS